MGQVDNFGLPEIFLNHALTMDAEELGNIFRISDITERYHLFDTIFHNCKAHISKTE